MVPDAGLWCFLPLAWQVATFSLRRRSARTPESFASISEITIASLRNSPTLPGPLSQRDRTFPLTEVKRMQFGCTLTAEFDPLQTFVMEDSLAQMRTIPKLSNGLP